MPYINPIKHRVLIHRDEEATQSEGKHGVKIYLPENRKTADEKRSNLSVKGTVINVGELVDQAWLAPGDRVIYRWYTGDEFKVNDHRCVMIYDDEILARDKRDDEA